MRRSPKLPEVPAFSEIAEFKGFEVISWVALFAPAGTPKEIVDRLSGVIKQAQNKAEVKEKIAAFAAEGDSSGSEELGVFVKAQLSTWGRLIKDAGIQPE
jgi:tripartite-type tricarboxylate transporter receptor subunit TctC